MQRETEVVRSQHNVGPAELLEYARSLVPHLRQRVQEMDQRRQLPEATVKELLDAGLFQLTIPRLYGGHQISMRTFMDVVAEIGRGDASTAWAVSLINASNWLMATLYSEQAQQEIFSVQGEVRAGSVLQPRQCGIKRVEGGYLIEKGMWGFNSGAYQANWDILGIPLLDEQGEAIDQGLAILPMQDVELLDDWHTIGMQGTGSTTVVVKNKFVPDHRIASFSQAINGNYNSLNLRAEPEYNWALVPTLSIILTFPLLGAARAMLEIFLERLPSRAIQSTWYTKQAEATITHLQVAEASAKIDAAQLLLQRAADDIDAWGARREYMEYMQRARVRSDCGFATRLLYEAGDTIADATGGSFAASNNPLNHIWRDIRTGSLHAVLNPSTNQELYGRLLY